MAKAVCAILVTVALAALSPAHGNDTSGQLVPVKPGYDEEAQQSRGVPDGSDPSAGPLPTPRDQMYVFWILGRILSYPVDRVEGYIRERIDSWKTEAVARPASAPASPNPFESLRWREIPPAPPATTLTPAEKRK